MIGVNELKEGDYVELLFKNEEGHPVRQIEAHGTVETINTGSSIVLEMNGETAPFVLNTKVAVEILKHTPLRQVGWYKVQGRPADHLEILYWDGERWAYGPGANRISAYEPTAVYCRMMEVA